MGVRQEYGHLCTLVDKALFAGLTQCFIIDEEYYNNVAEILGMKFEYGFVVSGLKGENKVQGN